MNAPHSLAVFWDITASPCSELSGFEVVRAIRAAVEAFGPIRAFRFYLNLSRPQEALSTTLRSELQCSGVSLVDAASSSREGAPVKMMIADSLVYALDTPVRSTLVIISGDPDVLYTTSLLSMRGHRVLLLCPPGAHVNLVNHPSINGFDRSIFRATNERVPNFPDTSEPKEQNLPSSSQFESSPKSSSSNQKAHTHADGIQVQSPSSTPFPDQLSKSPITEAYRPSTPSARTSDSFPSPTSSVDQIFETPETNPENEDPFSLSSSKADKGKGREPLSFGNLTPPDFTPIEFSGHPFMDSPPSSTRSTSTLPSGFSDILGVAPGHPSTAPTSALSHVASDKDGDKYAWNYQFSSGLFVSPSLNPESGGISRSASLQTADTSGTIKPGPSTMKDAANRDAANQGPALQTLIDCATETKGPINLAATTSTAAGIETSKPASAAKAPVASSSKISAPACPLSPVAASFVPKAGSSMSVGSTPPPSYPTVPAKFKVLVDYLRSSPTFSAPRGRLDGGLRKLQPDYLEQAGFFYTSRPLATLLEAAYGAGIITSNTSSEVTLHPDYISRQRR